MNRTIQRKFEWETDNYVCTPPGITEFHRYISNTHCTNKCLLRKTADGYEASVWDETEALGKFSHYLALQSTTLEEAKIEAAALYHLGVTE